MTKVPTGSELARPFVPAKVLELSKRFYIRLGFESVLDNDVAIFRVGSSGFTSPFRLSGEESRIKVTGPGAAHRN